MDRVLESVLHLLYVVFCDLIWDLQCRLIWISCGNVFGPLNADIYSKRMKTEPDVETSFQVPHEMSLSYFTIMDPVK